MNIPKGRLPKFGEWKIGEEMTSEGRRVRYWYRDLGDNVQQRLDFDVLAKMMELERAKLPGIKLPFPKTNIVFGKMGRPEDEWPGPYRGNLPDPRPTTPWGPAPRTGLAAPARLPATPATANAAGLSAAATRRYAAARPRFF